MNYRKLMLPSLIVIVASLFTGFGVQEKQAVVARLLEDRAFILQRAYYGEMDVDEAERQLYQVETQPLLREDIAALRKTDYCDLDIIEKLEVGQLQPQMSMFENLSFEGRLTWYMQGLSGNYIYDGNYYILLKSCSGKWKLSQFTSLEEQ